MILGIQIDYTDKNPDLQVIKVREMLQICWYQVKFLRTKK